MSHKIYIEEDGEIRTVTIAETDSDLPTESDRDRESYGELKEEAIAKLQDIHETIRFYTRYAIGAFKNLGDAQVEEVTLKFGLKIGGEAGIPILTKASAESNFEIQVRCKFPS
jgi:hypothetical protein